jgi:hypothetical protein
MDAAFGATNDFTQPPDTLFAKFANFSDDSPAGCAYVRGCSVFLSLDHDTDMLRLILHFVPF